jgi:cysteine desulfurase
MKDMNPTNRKQIYLDFNASTPIDPRVEAVMHQAMESVYGNPSSPHWAGTPARIIVEAARQKVATLLGCKPGEIVFTSGGSESNNQVLKGNFFARHIPNAHIITTEIEHPAIVEPCHFLERLGARVTWLPVDATGRVNANDLRQSITGDTILISIMHANNEVGTIQPIENCARIAREHGIPFHTDAAQSVGKVPTKVEELGVDFLTIAGHKLYAPKGIGALYIREGSKLEPLIHGAGHERGHRAGTESTLLTAALGEACELARDLSGMARIKALRDRLWTALKEGCGDRVVLNGHPEERLPNTLNVSFLGHVGNKLLAQMPKLAASTGSACHEDRVEVSPVLHAMGVSQEVGVGAVRFSLGRTTTSNEIEAVIKRLIHIVTG